MNKEIKRICGKKPEEITMVEYQNLKLSMLNQLGRTNGPCDGVWCADCCLDNEDSCTSLEMINPQEAIKKVQEWHKENTLKVDWSKVPVDTPIWVWEDGCEGIKIKRHFAKFEDGKIYVWNDGKTSWTAEKDKWSVEEHNYVSTTNWDNAELAEEKIYE
jgi:hypothetical protein